MSKLGNILESPRKRPKFCSRHNWGQLRAHPETHQRHITMISKGFEGALNWTPMMPKDAVSLTALSSLSKNKKWISVRAEWVVHLMFFYLFCFDVLVQNGSFI